MAAFAERLRAIRTRARQSQFDLALAAGISQRHLSFIESGRAKPGRDVVLKLAKALRLAPANANDFLSAAGFAAAFPPRAWTSAEMAPVRAAATHILKGHMPYPAVLIDDTGDIIEANPALDRVLALLGEPAAMWRRTHGDRPHNLLRLTLHPKGPAAALVNFPDVARATLLRAAAETPRSERLQQLLTEITKWPNIDPAWLEPNWGPAPAPIIEERYRVGKRILGIFAVTTTIGAPMDVTAGALRIESYFPANEESRRAITAAKSAR